MKVLILALALLIGACASTPTSIGPTPASGLVALSPTGTLGADLLAASWNLDQALAVKALPSDDPAPACLHDVLKATGLEQTAGSGPPATFAPEYKGVASTAAVAYILKRQADQLAGTKVDVSTVCKALVGQIVIDSAKDVNKAAATIVTGVAVVK